MSGVREEAARWFVRLHGEGDARQRARFERWLAASPEHAAEYQAFAELWGELSSPRGSEALADAMERRRAGRRRHLLRGTLCGALLVLAGFAGLHLYRQGPQDLALQTGIAEQRQERLRDGSAVSLNADTRLHVKYDEQRRHVTLQRGEAVFEVERNPDRPFVVDGGVARVTVLGTRFAVDRLRDRLRVSVDHGLVRVDSLTAPGHSLQLHAGEVVEVDAEGELHRLSLPADNAFAFQAGRLVFEQADLAEIAASLSRYRQQPVRVVGGGGPRIDAVVQLGEVEDFLDALPAIAPVRLEHQTRATLLYPR